MHHSLRSITSSEAKSNLGELLASLGSQGAVEITRNGKPVGILSPPFAQPVDAGRLASLALATRVFAEKLGKPCLIVQVDSGVSGTIVECRAVVAKGCVYP